MIDIKIDSLNYRLKTETKDITLSEFIDLQKIVHDIPTTLDKFYEAISKGEEYDGEVDEIEWLYFYEDVFRFMSGYEEVDIKIDPNDLIAVYNKYLAHFIIKSIYPQASFDEEPTSEIEIKGKKYYLPEKYMKDSVLEQYGEISDSMNNKQGLQEYYSNIGINKEMDKIRNGNLTAYPYMLAILYKPKGERFDSKKIDERAKLFLGLTMDVVFGCDVFFWKLTGIYNKNTERYLWLEKVKLERPIRYRFLVGIIAIRSLLKKVFSTTWIKLLLKAQRKPHYMRR